MDENNVIENNFSYHAPKVEQIHDIIDIKHEVKNVAYLIDEYCPNSREKSLAMTKLEEAVMWANACIIRN